MVNRISSRLSPTKEPLLLALFYFMLLDLFIGGGGRLIDIGLLSIRMYLFFVAVSISFLVLYFVHRINKEILTLLAIFSITLFFSSLVALLQDVSLRLVLRDLKPLIFFYVLIFFNLMIQQEEDVVKVETLIKLASLILATGYILVLIGLRIGIIDFAKFYSSVYSTEEFYFRGNIGFMYKGFVYLCIGFFFYFRSHQRKHKLITVLLLIAIFLTFTRGFILALACTLVIYLVLFKKNKLLSLFVIIAIITGVLMVWSTLNSSALGDKSVSNSVRIIQIQQVWENLTPLSLIIGHGFGVGVPISPVHMEIAYLEIVHKQGLIGLAFWILLFAGICLKFWQASKKGYFDQALPFFLSTVFVYIESFTNPFILSPLGMTVVMLSWVCLNVLRKKMNISVCMATYNGEKYIARQLASILPQLSHTDEIIISDDSSTDQTIRIIEGFDDERIKIFKGNKFYNPTLNFENALKQAHNDLIFLADQDDIWEPGKVKIMGALLQSFDLVLSDCTIVDSNGEIIHNSYFEYIQANKGLIRNMYKSPYMGCCMAFNKKILEIALPIPKGVTLHDWWIGMVAEVHGKVYFCPEKLMQYVRHGSNASNTGFKSKNSLKTKLMMRLNLSFNLVKTLF